MTYQPGEPRAVYEETPLQAAREDARIAARSNNTTAWIVAALIAVVAIIAVAFMVASANRETAVTQEDLAIAAEQARALGALEGAQAGYNAAATQAQVQSNLNAQSSYNAQAANAQLAADRAAADARAAAAESRAAAERSRAQAAEAAARDPVIIDDSAPQQ